MTIHVSGPDGSSFEFPDGTPGPTISQAMQAHYGSQRNPVDVKVDAEVAHLKEKYGYTAPPDMARGIPIIGPFLDEAAAGIQGAVHSLSGGQVGRSYEDALAYQRALDRAADKEHPVWSTAGRFATGVATGGPIFGRIAPAATLAGRIGQGAVTGGLVGAAEGFGSGEGGFGNRLDSAETGAQWGAGLGAVLPVGISAFARSVALAGQAGDAINPAITRLRYGPEAAADEILATRIAREGSSPAQKRLDLQRGQTEAATLGPGSRAELPETIADTSDAMQRLTGSAYRSSGEAGNLVRRTLDARQRGPANPYAPQPGEPTGQQARIMDATQRALQIRSAGTAYQTEQRLMRDQQAEGARLYAQARRASEDFDIQPALDGLALTAQQYPAPFQARLNRAINLFRDDTPRRMPIDTVERFDSSKRALDDMIESAQRQGQGNLVRELTQFKQALLDRVHMPDASGAPTINVPYHQARAAWGSAAENREAIDLGRAALREGSEITAEQFRNLSRGQQQLFRLGYLESLRNALATRKPGNDVTQLFQQRRVQELMHEIIPVPRGRNATFANRPERFGELMRREERMVQTRNAVLGGSQTAQRQQDDLQAASEAAATLWSRFKAAPSFHGAVMEAVGHSIQRLFAYRQDVALALAQRLLESDPAVRNQILQRLRGRAGPDVFARFSNALDRSTTTLTGAIPSAVVPAITSARQEEQRHGR